MAKTLISFWKKGYKIGNNEGPQVLFGTFSWSLESKNTTKHYNLWSKYKKHIKSSDLHRVINAQKLR